MKANELMIGDWVDIKATNSFIYKRRKITANDLIDSIHRECVYIPLTAEILKKNGFRRVMFDFVLDMMHIRRDENMECFYIVVGGKEMRIDYVHELQHALRLCGIDKEIVL